MNYKNQVFLWSLVNFLRITMNLLKIADIIFWISLSHGYLNFTFIWRKLNLNITTNYVAASFSSCYFLILFWTLISHGGRGKQRWHMVLIFWYINRSVPTLCVLSFDQQTAQSGNLFLDRCYAMRCPLWEFYWLPCSTSSSLWIGLEPSLVARLFFVVFISLGQVWFIGSYHGILHLCSRDFTFYASHDGCTKRWALWSYSLICQGCFSCCWISAVALPGCICPDICTGSWLG